MPANPLGVALRSRRAGHDTLVWAYPDLQAPENFALTSPAFDHGAPIPERHRGRLLRPNISPALNWTQPPAGTVELVLIVQDPDVPLGKPATHALTLGIDRFMITEPRQRYSLTAFRDHGTCRPNSTHSSFSVRVK